MKRLAVFIIALFSLLGAAKTNAQVDVGVSVGIAPPELPVYAQPPCPTDGYLWSPGYWAYGPNGYYWVPGVWVLPPTVGFLWTPGYWGFDGGNYFWHGGYWGDHVGFYGGVCYGYGYGGTGFYGGRWEGGRFAYNTAAWHVNGGFHNTYNDRAAVVNNGNRASFNGHGGVDRQPTAEERTAMGEHHVQATSAQVNHEHSASVSRNQLASVNHGNPTTTARTTVGGDRFNSGGKSISTIHAANANHPANGNNAAHTSAAPQQQHNVPINKPAAQPQRNASANRPAAQPQRSASPGRPAAQPQRNNVQRSAPPQRQPQGGVGRGSGGGEGGHEKR